MAAPTQHTDLLLIGKTGNGKSATGNSILGRKVFQTSSTPSSVTKSVQFEYASVNDRTIKVVDGPGVGDTDLSQEEGLNLVVDSLKLAIAANPDGYHAILLVLKFGGRFTREDQQTVSTLKGIFGANFVEVFTILVVTCGDHFDLEDSNETFEEWCSKERGVFKSLLDECGQRVVLFNNKTKDRQVLDNQRERLLQMVDRLAARGTRYTNEHFQQAHSERDRMMLEMRVPVIREDIMREASLVIQQLARVETDNPREHLERLKIVKVKADSLLRNVMEQDRNTGLLRDMIENARHIQRSVEQQIQYTQRAIEEERRQEDRRQEMERLRARQQQQLVEMEEEGRRQREREAERMRELEEEDRASVMRVQRMRQTMRDDNEQVQNELHHITEQMMSQVIHVIGTFLSGLLFTAVRRFIFRF